MSDAAQKAVAEVLYGEFVELLGEHLTEDQVQSHVGGVTRAVLAVLSETHAVVELPELEAESVGWDGERHNVVCDDGLIEVDVSVVDPVEARELAAHLLAAARVAEGGGSRG